jgi:hypothetical protein
VSGRALTALVSLVLVLAAGRAAAQGVVVYGHVVDAITQRPLGGAAVSILGTQLRTVTRPDGTFRLTEVPTGVWRVQVAAIGYRPAVRSDVVVAPARATDVRIQLEPLPLELVGIVIQPQYFEVVPQAVTSVQTLSNEEIRRLPGGLEDVARAVAVLPGVVQVSEGRNDLIVRGGAPSENLYLIDGVEVDNINHFGTQGATGGPLSFVNLDFVRDVTFSTGGFGAEYGDRLSSVLAIDLKEGRSDRRGGRATLASAQFGLDLEGPLGSAGSFLLSARRSYLDFIFKAAGFGFVPEYWDFLGRWSYDPSPKDAISFFAIGALDNVRFFNETADQRYDNARILGNAQDRYVAGLSYRRLLPRGYLDVRLGRNFVTYEFIQRDSALGPVFVSDSRESETALRVDGTWLLPGEVELRTGVQGKVALVHGYRVFPEVLVTEYGDTLPGDSVPWDRTFTKVAGYAEAAHTFAGRLRLTGGVRLDAFPALDHPVAWGPRAGIAFAADARTTLTASGGVYRQSPAYVWLAGNPANARLSHIRTDQIVLGVERRLRPDTRVRLEAYHKRYRHYAASTARTYLVLANAGAGFGGVEDGFAAFGFDALVSEGSGSALGVELLLQKRLSEIPLYGTAAVSVGEARYTPLDGLERSGTYDRRVTVNVGGGYRFNARWEASMKFRLGTGLPYTPYRADGTRDPLAFNTARFPLIHALDVRVDRRWIFRAWNLVTYVDVQNVYNRDNVQSVRWDPRLSRPEFASSFGIFPTIGLSAEF